LLLGEFLLLVTIHCKFLQYSELQKRQNATGVECAGVGEIKAQNELPQGAPVHVNISMYAARTPV
jgi:hypothetical protein